jgi:hypothetical protein
MNALNPILALVGTNHLEMFALCYTVDTAFLRKQQQTPNSVTLTMHALIIICVNLFYVSGLNYVFILSYKIQRVEVTTITNTTNPGEHDACSSIDCCYCY